MLIIDFRLKIIRDWTWSVSLRLIIPLLPPVPREAGRCPGRALALQLTAASCGRTLRLAYFRRLHGKDELPCNVSASVLEFWPKEESSVKCPRFCHRCKNQGWVGDCVWRCTWALLSCRRGHCPELWGMALELHLLIKQTMT